jgi:hypothetical protein
VPEFAVSVSLAACEVPLRGNQLNCSTLAPRCDALFALAGGQERGHHDAGFESAHPRNIGLLWRASDMPAKTAKKIAIAGCMKTRKLIGPLKRPTKFSQPRARASSMNDVSSAQIGDRAM